MLWFSKNRALRKILDSKRDQVKDEWRKLHNEELRDLYSSPNFVFFYQTNENWMDGNVRCMGEKRNRPAYRVLVAMSKKEYHSEDPGLVRE
jgi:hypothetical protein